MKTRLFAFALAIATTFAFAPVSNTANAAPNKVPVTAYSRATALTTPITASSPAGSFVGNLDITRFVKQGSQLLAVGTLTGTLTNALTGATQTVNQLVQIPVIGASGTCAILHLTLGPIDLNLLGLVVHTNQIVLNIDAQSGPGNLLGNLLCAVANLLNGGGALTALTGLLNQILGQL